jgi:hypothetical protein
MGQANWNARRLWPALSIGALLILSIAAATGSGLEAASARGHGVQKQSVTVLPPLTSPPHVYSINPGGPAIFPGAPAMPTCLDEGCTPPPPISLSKSLPTSIFPWSNPTPAAPRPTPVRTTACKSSLSAGSLPDLNPDPRDGLAGALVPISPTAPISVTICRYAGLDQQVKSGDIERSRVLVGQQLANLVGDVDNPGWQTVSFVGPISCPISTGAVDSMRFVYSSGPDVTVSIAVNGCEFLSNGRRTVWGGPVAQTLAEYVGSDTF